jgi:hypothetical protein
MAGLVLNSSSVLRLNLCAKLKICAPISATSPSCKTFEAGAYYSPDKSKWTTYVQIEKFDRNSMVFLSTEDFASLLSLIEQAKTKM